jgi:hypothetical protein
MPAVWAAESCGSPATAKPAAAPPRVAADFMKPRRSGSIGGTLSLGLSTCSSLLKGCFP